METSQKSFGEHLEAACEKRGIESPHSIKLTRNEGVWYVDAKTSPAGSFKPDSRWPTFDRALDRVSELAGVTA